MFRALLAAFLLATPAVGHALVCFSKPQPSGAVHIICGVNHAEGGDTSFRSALTQVKELLANGRRTILTLETKPLEVKTQALKDIQLSESQRLKLLNAINSSQEVHLAAIKTIPLHAFDDQMLLKTPASRCFQWMLNGGVTAEASIKESLGATAESIEYLETGESLVALLQDIDVESQLKDAIAYASRCNTLKTISTALSREQEAGQPHCVSLARYNREVAKAGFAVPFHKRLAQRDVAIKSALRSATSVDTGSNRLFIVGLSHLPDFVDSRCAAKGKSNNTWKKILPN